MMINNEQLTDAQLADLDKLVEVSRVHDGGAPAIYYHLLVLKRDTPNNFLYYTPASVKAPAQLIGFLSLYFFYENDAEVSLLVHPDYRHQDIANMLLERALPLCKLKKIQKLVFSTPPDYHPPLLDAMGAKLDHREYHLTLTMTSPVSLLKPKLLVRPAKQADLSQLCELDAACFHTDNGDVMKDRFITLLAAEEYHVLVATLDGVMIGKVHLRFDPDEVFLSDLSILPAQQRKGFGRELLLQAMRWVQEQGMAVISLEVETAHAHVLTLYTAQGFEIVDTIDFYKVELEVCT